MEGKGQGMGCGRGGERCRQMEMSGVRGRQAGRVGGWRRGLTACYVVDRPLKGSRGSQGWRLYAAVAVVVVPAVAVAVFVVVVVAVVVMVRNKIMK